MSTDLEKFLGKSVHPDTIFHLKNVRMFVGDENVSKYYYKKGNTDIDGNKYFFSSKLPGDIEIFIENMRFVISDVSGCGGFGNRIKIKIRQLVEFSIIPSHLRSETEVDMDEYFKNKLNECLENPIIEYPFGSLDRFYYLITGQKFLKNEINITIYCQNINYDSGKYSCRVAFPEREPKFTLQENRNKYHIRIHLENFDKTKFNDGVIDITDNIGVSQIIFINGDVKLDACEREFRKQLYKIKDKDKDENDDFWENFKNDIIDDIKPRIKKIIQKTCKKEIIDPKNDCDKLDENSSFDSSSSKIIDRPDDKDISVIQNILKKDIIKEPYELNILFYKNTTMDNYSKSVLNLQELSLTMRPLIIDKFEISTVFKSNAKVFGFYYPNNDINLLKKFANFYFKFEANSENIYVIYNDNDFEIVGNVDTSSFSFVKCEYL